MNPHNALRDHQTNYLKKLSYYNVIMDTLRTAIASKETIESGNIPVEYLLDVFYTKGLMSYLYHNTKDITGTPGSEDTFSTNKPADIVQCNLCNKKGNISYMKKLCTSIMIVVS